MIGVASHHLRSAGMAEPAYVRFVGFGLTIFIQKLGCEAGLIEQPCTKLGSQRHVSK